jgi:hypothetical protein
MKHTTKPPGRPSTLNLRPDSVSKRIITKMGGVGRAQKLLANCGFPFTRPTLYRWLEIGHIPRTAIWMVVITCQKNKIPLTAAEQGLVPREWPPAPSHDTAPPPEAPPAGWGRGSL